VYVRVYVCKERERVFSAGTRWYLQRLKRGLNISKEWLKQAIQKDWNVMLAHHVTGMGLVNHEDTGTLACHMFQIIMNKERCQTDICLYQL